MSLAHARGVLRRTSCSSAGAALRRAGAGVVSPARRFATSQQQQQQKKPSSGSAAQFYKTFTRPVGKVLVLAIFTYQVAYWTWLKLEADEHRAETDATIAALEDTVEEYKRAKDGAGKSP
ncbi:hypothetical protein CCMA1212_002436 [Trichoderma ghanense]|uniref:Uncharacterized protein n=1 Tax=Trichoderma ghanense TaxID=65468 RepID=A0ABY2HCN6_9HYPO